MKKSNLIKLIALPVLLACGFAKAAVVTETVSGSVSGGPIGSSGSLYDTYEDLSIPTFDSSLGTLVNVSLAFSGTTYGEIELDNDDPDDGVNAAKEITAELTLRFGLWSSDTGNSDANQSNLLMGLALGSYDPFTNNFTGPTYIEMVDPESSVTIGNLADGDSSEVAETATDTLNLDSSNTGTAYTLGDFIGNGTEYVSLFFSTYRLYIILI